MQRWQNSLTFLFTPNSGGKGKKKKKRNNFKAVADMKYSTTCFTITAELSKGHGCSHLVWETLLLFFYTSLHNALN